MSNKKFPLFLRYLRDKKNRRLQSDLGLQPSL